MDNIIKTAVIARESYNSQRIVPDSKYTFAGFLALLFQTNKALSSARTRLETDKVSIIKTYTKEVADKKITELVEAYKAQVKTNKEKLYARFNEIMTGKKTALETYILVSPPDDLVKLFQTYQFRIQTGEKIGDNEWNMLVRRVSDSGNYQAMKILHDMAVSIDRDFPLPFEVDDKLSELDDAESMIMPVINSIDTPEDEWGYNHMVFLSGTPNNTTEWLAKLDSDLGMSVQEHQKTYVERLKESAQVALHENKVDLFNEIYAFIAENRNQLMTAEEAEREIIDKAEQLIVEGMAANE